MCKIIFNNIRQRFDIVSRVAFLAGVRESVFRNEYEPMDEACFDELINDQNARIIRNLCALRTLIEQNYSVINYEMNAEIKNLDNVANADVVACVRALEADGIALVTPNLRLDRYVIKINGLISDRINNCRRLFPDQVRWDYIKELFVMPGGTTEEGVKAEGFRYQRNKSLYPYQVYLGYLPNTEPENILYNDKKLLSLIYAYHQDKFTAYGLVTERDTDAREILTAFLRRNERTVIVIDGENSNPGKALEMLLYIEQENLADKISKVILYNDVNTGSTWRLPEAYSGISFISRMTRRVKENKSLVDIRLSAGLCREHYQNMADSFIILASDSDYCGVIEELPDAHFLVMTEYDKCSNDMVNALDKLGASHAELDEFEPDSERLVLLALVDALPQRINKALNGVNVFEFIRELCPDAVSRLSAAQKKNTAQKFAVSLRLTVGSNGELNISADTAQDCA